jgi:excisionase family DNA binding protein
MEARLRGGGSVPATTATDDKEQQPITTTTPDTAILAGSHSGSEQTGTPERFLTARELADILSVHENYIYDQAARGLIPSYKFGGCRRFRWGEIEQWLDTKRQRSYDPTRQLRNS